MMSWKIKYNCIKYDVRDIITEFYYEAYIYLQI